MSLILTRQSSRVPVLGLPRIISNRRPMSGAGNGCRHGVINLAGMASKGVQSLLWGNIFLHYSPTSVSAKGRGRALAFNGVVSRAERRVLETIWSLTARGKPSQCFPGDLTG